MNFRNLFLLVCLVLLLGCSRDAMQDELRILDDQEMIGHMPSASEADMVNPHLNGKAVERTLKFQRLCGEYRYTPSEDCGPEYFLFTIEGAGIVSHVGKYPIYADWCVLRPYGPPVPGQDMEGAIPAPNGDKLFTKLDYAGPGEDGYHDFHYFITDGTGRFTGADGYYTIHIKFTVNEENWLTGAWEGYGEGVVTY